MPTNTAVTSSLIWRDVPPDLVCIPGDMNLLGGRLADFLSVVTVQGQTPGGPTDSIAQQALETANISLATSQQALAATPNIRSNGPFSVMAGDSPLQVSWSPAFANTNYAVFGTFYGGQVHPGAYFAFHVVEASRTVNGCEIRFQNVPASFKFAWVAMALPQP